MTGAVPIKDGQTVTPNGKSMMPLISGVILRPQVPIEDERGEVCEIYSPSWGVHEAPIVYAYESLIRPNKVKGWIVHRLQDDRIFMVKGTVLFALYDDRTESPTHGLLNKFVVSERNRALLIIPAGVYHGLKNIGDGDAIFVNLPTRPYDHANPDKYRLPLKNDIIPFAFEETPGW